MKNLKSIQIKPIALLTGAYTAGMGSSIRKVLHNAGWSVIALYDPTDKLQLALSNKDLNSIKIAVNLRDAKSIVSMIEQLPSHIDAFIHAAMFFEMDTTFNQNIWLNTLQINVISAAQIVESLRSHLKGGGSIVAISSTEAFTGSFGSPAYSASRAAMHNLVQSWANKFGSEGIRANAIAAGWIGGVMDTDEVFNQSRRITPLGRLGLPEEVANTTKFLCSNEASFINGSVVTVDGGYSCVDNVSKYEYQEHLATTDFQRFTSEFMVGRAGRNDEIWAVSMMFTGEWESDEATKFKSDQLAAAERGAQINRIFVVSPEQKHKLYKNHPLVLFHHKHPRIHAFVVDKEVLKKQNSELLVHLGHGWTAFNDEVLVLDEANTAESRGVLVTRSIRLVSLRHDFEQLLKIASPL